MARRRRSFGRARRSRAGLLASVAVALLLGAYAAVLVNSRPEVGGRRLPVSTFVDLANQHRIRSARILDQDAFVVGIYVRPDGTTAPFNTPYLREGNSRERLLDVLFQNHVTTTIDQQFGKRLFYPATILVPGLIVVVVFVYLLFTYSRGTGLFGVRSGARRVAAGEATARFADVAGQEAAITELAEVKAFLSDPERFAALGAVVPKGILLCGPPGCGKTLLARAVAGEAGAAFYSISGSDFVELYAGVGAARVRELFKEARLHAPAIVFIDEVDSVGRRRGTTMGADTSEQEQALNQILAEMDGFSPTSGVIVLAATNRPDVLDPALLRPGRFDRTVALERPDEAGRRAILDVHGRGKRLDPGVDLGAIAHRAVGLSGADLASVMNEGALLAARAGHPAVDQGDLGAALARILEAPDRQRRLSQRARSFSRSAGERVRFSDVAGMDSIVAELAEVASYLSQPERFVAMGARPPRGVLLVGPPGCGKTMLARAVAGEANAAFFSVAGSEFVELFAGEGAARVRDLFAEARALAPAIVFLDEIDAVGARRTVAVGNHRESEQTLNQILVELDGFDARSGVIVLAASNRPEILDPALVRPGRFDRTVTVSLPGREARRAILGLHSRGKPLAPDVDLDVVVGMTPGLSGADLANLLNEAALLATRRGRSLVSMVEVEEAVERVAVGVHRTSRLSEEDRRIVAYHEAGHALVALALPGTAAPRKVSIVARGRALGATWHTEGAERTLLTKTMLLDQLAALLGGRAAEELVVGEAVSGAADDLARVDALARQMVCELGMGDGLANRYFDPLGGEPPPAAVEGEIGRLVEDAYERARAVLVGSRDGLDRVAAALLDAETVTAEELVALARRSASEPAGITPRPGP
ncbi:MAG TPA: AAA family ATPase [Acidimicrobiales bacterium]|nr:AAA family ATPase [Acidimicrobiales bacterium]